MAETLLGPHYELVCPDCGMPLVVRGGRGRGRLSNGLSQLRLSDERPGVAAGDCRRPRADRPDHPGLARRRGDGKSWPSGGPKRAASWWSSGLSGCREKPWPSARATSTSTARIQRKTLDRAAGHADPGPRRCFSADDANPPCPPAGKARRARPRHGAGRTAASPAIARRPDEIDWLVYQHWRRGTEAGQVVAVPVLDLSSYNQGRPRRNEDVHPVTDLILSVRVAEVRGDGRLWLRAATAGRSSGVELDPAERSFEVSRGGHERRSFRGPAHVHYGPVPWRSRSSISSSCWPSAGGHWRPFPSIVSRPPPRRCVGLKRAAGHRLPRP